MDKELREIIKQALINDSCYLSEGEVEDHTEAVFTALQSYYAKLAEKEGLVELVESGLDGVFSYDNMYGSEYYANNILAKVLPWHEAQVSKAVKAERERIWKILETFTDSQEYLKSLRVMIIHNPDFKIQEKGGN